MSIFRRKQGVIKAFQWRRESTPDWLAKDLNDPKGKATVFYRNDDPMQGRIMGVQTNHGTAHAFEGDYIILNESGEIYPCGAETFEKNHEKICDEG